MKRYFSDIKVLPLVLDGLKILLTYLLVGTVFFCLRSLLDHIDANTIVLTINEASVKVTSTLLFTVVWLVLMVEIMAITVKMMIKEPVYVGQESFFF